MFRYIVLLWDPLATPSRLARDLVRGLQARRLRWLEVCDEPGLIALSHGESGSSPDLQILPDGVGVVAGVVFERNGSPLDDSPAARWVAATADSRAIVSSKGQWLIERCWGNYVAIIRDQFAGSVCILKDPVGDLPCLITTHEGVTVVFSCIADVVDAGLFNFRMRRSYLRNRVVFGGDAGVEPFENLRQICRGELFDPGSDDWSGVRRRFAWHPSAFAESGECIEDASYAARSMRATVRSCTHSLVGACHRIILRLSGGLDSSVIASCLKDAPSRPHVTCYTYYNPRGRSDERPWARLVAQQFGYEHVESPIEPENIRLQLALSMPVSVEPMPLMGYLLRSTLEKSLVAERRAEAVFCGDGGDSGFGGEAFAYALSEHLRRHGVDGGAFRLAAQIARLKHQSSWVVFGRAVRQAWFGAGMSQFGKMLLVGSRLLSAPAREDCERRVSYQHPWFADRDRVPWGTIRRLGMLLAMPQCYDVDTVERAPEVIAPLYAQPAIELFLQIPLYRLFENGRDRGLARRAFEFDIPRPISQRLWKDRAPGFDDDLVRLNRVFLRELLLDGILVREGLLDRTAVEQSLSGRFQRDPVLPGEIFRHLDVEIWARAWEAQAARHCQKVLPSLI